MFHHITISTASASDVITNSSTELFAVNGFGTADDVVAIVEDLWEEYLLDFSDDPDLEYVKGLTGKIATAFMPNDEYLARNAGDWRVHSFDAALKPGVVVLDLPINTPEGFIGKVQRYFNAPSETVG